MTRRAGRAGIMLVFVAACGGEAAPQTASNSSDHATRPAVERAAPAAEVAPTAVAELTDAELDALLAEWEASKDDATQERIEDRIAGGGPATLERLLARLSAEDGWIAAAVIPRFEGRAVLPVMARLPARDPTSRRRLVEILQVLAPAWRDGEHGPAVCRALLPLLSDEEVGGEVVWALSASRPAGASIAPQLVALWLSGTNREAEYAHEVLRALGTDAAAAAPAILAAAAAALPTRVPPEPDDEDGVDRWEWSGPRFHEALVLLRSIGTAEPSILDGLRKLLAPDGHPEVVLQVARLLGSWGDAAAAAAPELLAALRSPDPDSGYCAADALCRMDSVRERVWAEIRAAYVRGDAWTREDGGPPWRFARNRDLAPRLAEVLPALAPAVQLPLFEALVGGEACDLAALASQFVRHEDPDVRLTALEVLGDADAPAFPVEALARYLDDPDTGVRVHAATVLASRPDPPFAAIRDAILPLAGSGDADERRSALRSLGVIASRDPESLAALLAALDGDSSVAVREVAAEALARDNAPIPGDHERGVAWLAGRFEEHLRNGSFGADPWASALLRLQGGGDALARVVTAAAAGDVLEHHGALAAVLDALIAAGPRAAAARPVVARLRSETDVHHRSEFDRALAAIDQDPEALALTGWADRPTVERLVARGEPGRRAIVLLAGRCFADGEFWEKSLAGVPMEDAILAAVRPEADDPHATTRRKGAVRLARLLPTVQALGIYAASAGDEECSYDVAEELLALEKRVPGVVPLELARHLLARPDPEGEAFELAESLGPRGEDLLPLLRRIRDAGHPATSPRAAIALWHITRRAEESLPTLRTLLGSQRAWDRMAYLDVQDFGTAYASMPLTTADLDALLVAFRRLPDGSMPFAEALVPCLERFGPAADPAVPSLRRMLAWRGPSDSEDEGEPMGPAPVRVLGAIGPAARDAIPDIRKWASLTGDPGGVAREAIRKIESGAK